MLVTRTQCVCSITAAIVALAADTALIIELQYVLVTRNPRPQAVFALLWPPIVMGRPLYFTPLVSIFLLSSSCFFFFFSSPNLSGQRLDVYNASTHDVALARI